MACPNGKEGLSTPAGFLKLFRYDMFMSLVKSRRSKDTGRGTQSSTIEIEKETVCGGFHECKQLHFG